MTAISLLRLTRERLLALRPDLVIHDQSDEIQEPDTRAYASHPGGEFEVVFNAAGEVNTVFVYRESSLLAGLGVDFSQTRAAILARFGEPEASGAQQVDALLGPQGAWDRYLFPEHAVHFQYEYNSERLKLITFMTRRVVDRIGGGSV